MKNINIQKLKLFKCQENLNKIEKEIQKLLMKDSKKQKQKIKIKNKN